MTDLQTICLTVFGCVLAISYGIGGGFKQECSCKDKEEEK